MQLTDEGRQKVMMYIGMYGSEAIKTNEQLDNFITDAAETVSDSYFGQHIYKAIAYLAMHNICVSNSIMQDGGSGERVASKTIGPVSVTYKDMGRNASEYTTTTFGRLFMGLIRRSGGGISVNNSWRVIP